MIWINTNTHTHKRAKNTNLAANLKAKYGGVLFHFNISIKLKLKKTN